MVRKMTLSIFAATSSSFACAGWDVENPVTCRKHSELCVEPAKGLTALGALGDFAKDVKLPLRKGRRGCARREMRESVLALSLPLSAPLTCQTKKKFLHHLRFSLALSFLKKLSTKKIFN